MKPTRIFSNNTAIRTAVTGALIAASVFIPLLSFADTTASTTNSTASTTGPASILPASIREVGAPPMTTLQLGETPTNTPVVASSSTVTASSTSSTPPTEASSTSSSASTTPSVSSGGASSSDISNGGLVSVPQASAASTTNNNAGSNNSEVFAAESGGLIVDTSNPVLGFNPFIASASTTDQNLSVQVVPSINLTWHTPTPGTSVALFSTSTVPIDLTSTSTPSVSSSNLVTDHTVTLMLVPNTLYNIVLQSRDANGNLILSNFLNLDIQTASSTQIATSTQDVSAIPFNGTSTSTITSPSLSTPPPTSSDATSSAATDTSVSSTTSM